MINRIKKHTISFKNAFSGFLYVIKSQPNYQVHLFLIILSILAGVYFKISNLEWWVIFLLSIIGLSIETVNTAIESTCDAITYEIKPEIKVAKDVSAAAMLIFALGAFCAACVIFLPKFINLL